MIFWTLQQDKHEVFSSAATTCSNKIMTTERSLLFIHRGALGDFVLCFPLLEALGRAGYQRHLVARREHGDLARILSLCEGWLDCESGAGDDLLTQKEEALRYLKSKIKGLSLLIALVSDPDKKFQRWLSARTRLA